MSAMEDSLRRALEGGDAWDPAFRESIYAASERALERMLETRGSDQVEVDEQRARLAATIGRVEAEYQEPGTAADVPTDDVSNVEGYDDGDIRGPQAYSPEEADYTDQENWTPGPDRGDVHPAITRSGSRSGLLAMAAGLILIAILGFIAYTIFGGSTPQNTPPATNSGAATPPSENQESASAALQWIDIFDGNELEALSTPNGGRIEAAPQASGRDAVRISVPSGSESEATIAIGQGVLREIAGKSLRVELTAGSPDEKLREFSVRCVFGSASICERQRFSTSMGEEAFVFDMNVPTDVSGTSGIAIGPGISGTPGDVDIYSLRLRIL